MRVLLGAYVILFLRYCIATFLSAFFPQRTEAMGISDTFEGLIFTVFPVGITIMSFIAPRLVLKWGVRRCALLGMMATAVCTVLMGIVPDVLPAKESGGTKEVDAEAAQWCFMVAYFLAGFVGALADNAAIVEVGARFKACSGTVMASVGTVSGLGCMAGPPIGGVFCSDPLDTAQFRLPFLACGGMCAGAALLVPLFFAGAGGAGSDKSKAAKESQDAGASTKSKAAAPGDQKQGDTKQSEMFNGLPFSARRRAALSASVCITLGAIATNGLAVATLDPTLAYRLNDPSTLDYSSRQVGLMFMISSIAYVVTSIPVGWIVDKSSGNSAVFKLVQSAGFFALFVAFALLGPLEIGTAGAGASDAIESAFGRSGVTVVMAMVLKGLGSSGNNAGFPDLVIGIDADDEALHATIAGWWNAAYAAGWAFGPLLGGVIYDAVGFRAFATIVALTCLAFATVLFAAAFAYRNYTGPAALQR